MSGHRRSLKQEVDFQCVQNGFQGIGIGEALVVGATAVAAGERAKRERGEWGVVWVASQLSLRPGLAPMAWT